jgi:Leucine-rich repeat (LRR) protein
MSLNNIKKLSPFPSTDAVIFFTCENCKLSEIAINSFIDAKNIILLDLSHNEITSDSLHPDIFRGPHSDTDYSPINLQMLDLSHNKIKFLDEKLFEHTPILKKIVLNYNDLENIADGTLQALASCQHLEVPCFYLKSQ